MIAWDIPNYGLQPWFGQLEAQPKDMQGMFGLSQSITPDLRQIDCQKKCGEDTLSYSLAQE